MSRDGANVVGFPSCSEGDVGVTRRVGRVVSRGGTCGIFRLTNNGNVVGALSVREEQDVVHFEGFAGGPGAIIDIDVPTLRIADSPDSAGGQGEEMASR